MFINHHFSLNFNVKINNEILYVQIHLNISSIYHLTMQKKLNLLNNF